MNAKTIYIKNFKTPVKVLIHLKNMIHIYIVVTYTLNNTLVKCPIASSCIGMTWQFHYVVYLLNVVSVENASSKLLLK